MDWSSVRPFRLGKAAAAGILSATKDALSDLNTQLDSPPKYDGQGALFGVRKISPLRVGSSLEVAFGVQKNQLLM